MVVVAAFMGIVIAGWAALAATASLGGQQPPDYLRRTATVTWILIVIAGWAALTYLAWAVPGGLETTWRWVQLQPPVFRVAMWLFLLPWMLAIWIWQMPWSEPTRLLCVFALAALTLVLAMRQK